MKKYYLLIVSFLFLNLGFGQKSLQNKYGNTYSYSWILDSLSNPFEDSLVGVLFNVDNKFINFALKNHTNYPIKINWDDVSIILFNKTRKVIHNGIKFIDRNLPQSPTTIPPKSSLVDLVIPIDNIEYINDEWQIVEFMPKFDFNEERYKNKILESKGVNQLSLYIPLIINGIERVYMFRFIVSEINYRPYQKEDGF